MISQELQFNFEALKREHGTLQEVHSSLSEAQAVQVSLVGSNGNHMKKYESQMAAMQARATSLELRLGDARTELEGAQVQIRELESSLQKVNKQAQKWMGHRGGGGAFNFK